MPKAYQRKAFAFELKHSADDGTFTGTASVYGVKDLQGDVVDKGAFTKTLSERGTQVKLLWMHDQTAPIGIGTVTDSPAGLTIAGKLSLGTTKGRDVYELMKDGVIDSLSIGYDTIKKKFADGARHLQEVKLWEVSVVTFPANEDALVSAVKSADIDAWGLRPAQAAIARALLTKDASLNDKINAVYAAMCEAFPFGNAYVMEVYDDRAIVCTGDRYFSVALTWGDAEGDGEMDDPVLGEITEVERVYVPVHSGPKALEDAVAELKAGRVISGNNSEKLKTAHEHMTKAVEHVAAVIASGAPKKPAVGTAKSAAAIVQDDPDWLQSLHALTEALRPPAAA